MYKILFGIVISVLTIVTLCICLFKPQMHKTVMIYNSDYKIIENSLQVETVKNMPTQVNIIPTQQKTSKVEQETKLATSVNQIIPTTSKQSKTIQPKQDNIKQTTSVNKTNNTMQMQNIILPQSVQKIVNNTKEPVKQTITEKQKEEQELVLWNKWRSNLQNQIMNDVKLPIIPEGTIFKFSFEVDKYGKISNVKTWSLTPNYTPYAIQYIAPVIKSYQGRSILEFPTGSNRFSTIVEGGWRIAKTAKYSTPADYKDTEKVMK